MQIEIHDMVRWQSCDGTREGVVINIYNALDSFGDIINFYHIEYSDGFGGKSLAMIAETELHHIEMEIL